MGLGRRSSMEEISRQARETDMGRGLRLKLFAALLLRAMAQEQAEEGTEGVSPHDTRTWRGGWV